MNKECLKSLQRGLLILTSLLLLAISVKGYALPFNIFPTPGTSLPTQVAIGSSVAALYTIQNNTGTNRVNNAVIYLPLNVSQVTSDPAIPNLCGPTFNLAARGAVGDSCTLELRISGAVNTVDPDPHHHLFVCFPGNKTCAGTQFPLSVTVTTTPVPTPTLVPKFAYVTNFSNGIGPALNTISVCAVNTGGTFGNCTLQTDPTFFIDPTSIVLNSSGTQAYILNQGDSSVSRCSVNQTTGLLSACTKTVISGASVEAGGLTLKGAFLYVTSFGTPTQVRSCTLASDGSVGACAFTGSSFSNPNGSLAFNSTGAQAYVANFSADSLTTCTSNSGGTLNPCVPGQGTQIRFPLAVAANSAGNRLYVPNAFSSISSIPNTITTCALDASGVVGLCQNMADASFNFDQQIANLFLGVNQVAYVPNNGTNTVSICPVLSTGLLGACSVSTGNGTFTQPSSVWVSFQLV